MHGWVVLRFQEIRRSKMVIMGYFEKHDRELRMPRRRDAAGIQWNGPVLSGRQTMEGAPRGGAGLIAGPAVLW